MPKIKDLTDSKGVTALPFDPFDFPLAQIEHWPGNFETLEVPDAIVHIMTLAGTLNASLYKILYVHFSSGSALDLLRQIALELDLEPAHFRGDLVRQIAGAIVRLNQGKKQHPILICDEGHLLPHPALEQLPLLLNFDMDSSRYLTLLLVGQPLLRRTLSLQMHEALRQRIGVQYHLEGTHARRTRRLSGPATQSRRCVAAAV
jgi:AAA domain